jgi:uncharacterized protein (TIGR02996 family)
MTDDKHPQAFLDDIIDHPDDDTPRLVYADWLDEHGEPDRAEFIRVQCEMAKENLDPKRGRELRKRAAALLKEHEGRWAPVTPRAAVPGGWPKPPRSNWRRGFLHHFVCYRKEPEVAYKVLCEHPLRLLTLFCDSLSASEALVLAGWAHQPQGQRLRWITIGTMGRIAWEVEKPLSAAWGKRLRLRLLPDPDSSAPSTLLDLF